MILDWIWVGNLDRILDLEPGEIQIQKRSRAIKKCLDLDWIQEKSRLDPDPDRSLTAISLSSYNIN